MDTAEARIAELEEQVDRLQDAIVGMDVAIVDGYFVRVWEDDGEWIGCCPTVGAVVQLDSREEALQGIADDTRIMLEALAELGSEPPTKDITRTL